MNQKQSWHFRAWLFANRYPLHVKGFGFTGYPRPSEETDGEATPTKAEGIRFQICTACPVDITALFKMSVHPHKHVPVSGSLPGYTFTVAFPLPECYARDCLRASHHSTAKGLSWITRL